MKKDIHPDSYRLVVFKDMSNGDTFITKSCAESKEIIKIDGVDYPLIKREISSSSHPFYTGKMKLVDTAGRVDKFYKKFGKSSLTTKQEPVVEEPVVAEPVVAEPVVAEPVVEEPVVAEPVAEEPVAEEPVDTNSGEEQNSDKE